MLRFDCCIIIVYIACCVHCFEAIVLCVDLEVLNASGEDIQRATWLAREKGRELVGRSRLARASGRLEDVRCAPSLSRDAVQNDFPRIEACADTSERRPHVLFPGALVATSHRKREERPLTSCCLLTCSGQGIRAATLEK